MIILFRESSTNYQPLVRFELCGFSGPPPRQFQLAGDQLVWRTDKEGLPPAARFISSPYDLEAHYSRKNTTSWVGYKVHLTETCEDDRPHLITQVVTTNGPLSDGVALAEIHQGLKFKSLLPATHLVGSGYIDAASLVVSQERYKIDLLDPTRADVKWQARAGLGFAADNFKLNRDTREAICPRGKRSKSWSTTSEKGVEKVVVKFSQKDCLACSCHSQCTKAKRRAIHLRAQDHNQALVFARERQK